MQVRPRFGLAELLIFIETSPEYRYSTQVR